MKCNQVFSALMMLGIFGAAVSCSGSSGSKGTEPSRPEELKPGSPIVAIDGKVRFYVDVNDAAPRLAEGVSKDNLLASAEAVYVNGTRYLLEEDESGNRYADVMENSAGTYRASLAFEGGRKWYGSNPTIDIKVPGTQFCGGQTTGEMSFEEFPMYGDYSEATGNRLYMNDELGALDLTISGSGKVASVKLTCEGEAIAGSFMNTGGGLAGGDKAADHIVLNCTNDGEFMPMDNVFRIWLAPGEYRNAELVICDSERHVMHTSIDLSIASGEKVAKAIAWTPDKDVLWYEGFDLCAWGGDIMGGSSSFGVAPKAGDTDASYGQGLTGREYAVETVGYNVGGTGYIQPDNWSAINGKTVGAAHQMSDSYVKSRNFGDYIYMFRARELHGMMAVSYNTTARGILATPAFSNIEGFHKIKVSVRFCALSGFDDDFLANISNGGMIESATIDGQPIEFKSLGYRGAASEALIAKNSVNVPSSMMTAQKWQTLELIVDNATDASHLHFCGNTAAAGSHGFVVDEIKVEDLGESIAKGNRLRVLYWNVQNGMWSDQANEYANFISWVKRYDPDICVWCESASIYYDNTSKSAPDSERRLPAGWPEVAKKYGHQYSVIGGWRDNYPQEITSKYPIETLLKITDTDDAKKPIAHGAAIQQVNVNGHKINIVTLHTWPQAYGYGVPVADRDASAKKYEGDYYREYEMNYIISHTVNAPEYAAQADWLMMGDFNSKNPTEDTYYKIQSWYEAYDKTALYACQNAIKNNTNLVDIIGAKYPGALVSSTYGMARIDYMFASPSMYSKVKNAVTVIDSWAFPLVDDKYSTGFVNPSDHRPILVDFEL